MRITSEAVRALAGVGKAEARPLAAADLSATRTGGPGHGWLVLTESELLLVEDPLGPAPPQLVAFPVAQIEAVEFAEPDKGTLRMKGGAPVEIHVGIIDRSGFREFARQVTAFLAGETLLPPELPTPAAAPAVRRTASPALPVVFPRHPLGLPRGSVRALIALAVVLPAWVCLARGSPIAVPIQQLVLLILAYYLGMRGAAPAAEPMEPPPLGLPKGTIRWLLAIGFVLAVVYLAGERRLGGTPNTSFLLLVAGLIAGQAMKGLRRVMKAVRPAGVSADALAVATTFAAIALAILAVTSPGEWPPLANGLAAAITFYLGSRD